MCPIRDPITVITGLPPDNSLPPRVREIIMKIRGMCIRNVYSMYVNFAHEEPHSHWRCIKYGDKLTLFMYVMECHETDGHDPMYRASVDLRI
jgi:hypothetical protein